MLKHKLIYNLVQVLTLFSLLCVEANAMPPLTLRQDSINPSVRFKLVVESWVTTETARVNVSVAATHEQGELTTMRSQILEKLGKLAPKVDWHVTNFYINQNQSGLETVQLNAEARLDQTQISKIRNKAKDLSRPGLTLTIQGIEFTPSLADQERTRSHLRMQIYELAKAEVAAVNAMYSNHSFRLAHVDFINDVRPMQSRVMRTSMMKAVDGRAEAALPITVSQKLSQIALVTLEEQKDQSDDKNP